MAPSMMRPRLVLCCTLLGLAPVACGPGTDPDPGVDRGDSKAVDFDHLTITVNGRAEVFPEAARLLESQGQPLPALDGLALTIEEPLRVSVNDPRSALGHSAISTNGDFSVSDVPVREVNLSLAATVAHEGLVRTSTIVFDTVFTRTRPRLDIIGARAWALPLAFHDALTRSVGDANIRSHTGERFSTLREAGFVLGRVVDASGAPVAGARVVLDRPELASHVYYPTADFQSASQEGTSATGLFLYVHSGGETETFTVSVEGSTSYLPRHAGGTPGLGLVLTLSPGNTPP